MDHNHAVDSSAVERYLLSEMSADERDAFEDHYFSCSECADNVRTASRFRDAARIHLGSGPAPEPAEVKLRRRWWNWPQFLPSGAAAALAGVVVYLVGVEIPELKQRTAAPSAAVQTMVSVALRGTTRGGDEQERIPRGGEFFSVYFDVPAPSTAAAYGCEVANSQGKVAAKIDELLPRPDGSVNLLLSRANFPTGSYTITIKEGKIAVAQHTFTVE